MKTLAIMVIITNILTGAHVAFHVTDDAICSEIIQRPVFVASWDDVMGPGRWVAVCVEGGE